MVPTVESLTLVGPQTVEVCWRGTCTTEDLDVGRVIGTRPAVVDGRVGLSTPTGRWELTDTAVWWRPAGGAAVERLRVEQPGLAVREGDALWISTRKGLFRVTPTDIRSYVSVDATFATGHGERTVSVEHGQLHARGPDLPSCDLPLDATPRAMAFNGRRVVLYGSDVLVADVVTCRVVSALDLAVQGATWDGDSLLIASGGEVRVQRVDWRTLDVATVAGIRSAERVTDGPHGPVLAARGAVWDLGTGATQALVGNEVAIPGGYVRIAGHHVEQLDAAGVPLARYPLGKLRAIGYADALGGEVLVGDGSRIRLLGGAEWVAPRPVVSASLVGPGRARVRMADVPPDGADAVQVDAIIDFAGQALPVPASSSPVHPLADGTLTIASTLRPGPFLLTPGPTGLRVWAQVDGRQRGEEIPLVPEDALVTPDGRFVVTVQTGTVSGWEVATGRAKWSRVFEGAPVIGAVGRTFVDVTVRGERLLLDPNTGVTVWTVGADDTVGEPGGPRFRLGDPAAPTWTARPVVLPEPAVGSEIFDVRLFREARQRLGDTEAACRAAPAVLAMFDRPGAEQERAAFVASCNPRPERMGWAAAGEGTAYTAPAPIRWVEARDDGGALVMVEGAIGRLDAGLRRVWARAADSGQAFGDALVIGREATLNAWRMRDGRWMGSVHAQRYDVRGGRLWVTGREGDRFVLDAAMRVVERSAPRRYGATEAFGWSCAAGVCSFGSGTARPVHVGTVDLRLSGDTVVATRAGHPVWRREGVRFLLPIDHNRVLLVSKVAGLSTAVNAAGDTLATFGPERDWTARAGVVWGWSGEVVHRYEVPSKPSVAPSGVVVDAGSAGERMRNVRAGVAARLTPPDTPHAESCAAAATTAR